MYNRLVLCYTNFRFRFNLLSPDTQYCHIHLTARWHSIKPNKDELSLDITSSAADLLTALRYHLSFLELYLSPSLTVDIFETLATRIDKLLITEVYTCIMYM